MMRIRIGLVLLLAWGMFSMGDIPLLAADGAVADGPMKSAPTDEAIESIVDEASKERERALDAREKALSEREGRIAAMRGEVEKLVTQNEALRKELEERMKTLEAANGERIRHLILVYEAMAPEAAAPILSEMDETTALAIFSGMKGKSAAGIMAFLPKEKAADFGEKLARHL